MTRIDFYILNEASSTDSARFQLAAKIAEKATKRDQQVYINAENTQECERLDQVLWTFSQNSFLPHKVISSAPADTPVEPILIGSHLEVELQPWQVLINLANEVPSFFSRYERVAEIIDSHADRRVQGRARYKYYRERGYELSTHKL